ncbi:hypothetical protein J4468_02990 [Candidatus Woesearchaeota archaeon]|nr:hypothetical protein [Candidatus Woesearchaeota archaeon]
MRNKGKHESIVDLLEEKLSKKPYYDDVKSYVEYKEKVKYKSYAGEVDVLAFRKDTNTYYFFEVKCNYGKGRYGKALSQYNRYCKAYPKRKVVGIFVSDGVLMQLKKGGGQVNLAELVRNKTETISLLQESLNIALNFPKE